MYNEMTFDKKYSILGTKNRDYDGVFFTAVKTTGIFCRPSCRARIPKKENVVFYSSVHESLENGYRPCKICRPVENIGEIPLFVKEIIEELQQNPQYKVTDEDLKTRGIEPHTIRRWFKANYQMTFHSFQRLLRMNYAFNDIKKGKSITHSAFDNGYESLSGFNESYRTIFGVSASKSIDKSVVNVERFSSPIGSLIACASDRGICFLGFVGQENSEKHFKNIQQDLNAIILPGKNRHLSQLKKELEAYFEGKRKEFSVPLHFIGTAFRKEVWEGLQSIPYGKTVTYKEQAVAMNNPKAIRAIAAANGANKISIVVPCHRVIGSNGKLTGYAGGLPKKKWLLAFEQQNSTFHIQQKLEI